MLSRLLTSLITLPDKSAPVPESAPCPDPVPEQSSQSLRPERTVYRRRATDTDRPVTQGEVAALYQRPDSFTDLLPWTDYHPQTQTFLLEDGVSVGALFELTAASCEARPEDFMVMLRDQLQGVVTESIPEEDGDPWVLQLFVQDDPTLHPVAQAQDEYARQRAGDHAFTRHYLDLSQEHLQRISQPGGLFVDQAVTGGGWRGQQRRVRAVLYQRLERGRSSRLDGFTPEDALNEVGLKFTAALEAVGIRVRRGTAKDLYEWLLFWFNPNPQATDHDPQALLDLAPYPGDEDLPFGRDLAESLTFSMVRSDLQSSTWWFDELPHTVVTVQGLRIAPRIGHLTAERKSGEHVFALFDRLPEHSVMVLTLIIRPQDQIRNHIARIKHAASGDRAEAGLAREDAEVTLREMAQGNKLYPLVMAFYLRAQDLSALRRARNRLNALLIANGLQPISAEADLLALDSYIRNLPMAFDPHLDRTSRRSRLMFSTHIASLLPLYGRSTGTGHPGLMFFNRGAEPLSFDPLHRDDRKKNAHMLILGPTGAGKSALLVYLLMQMMAVYRPRVFIIEAGNSFGLLGQYFAAYGLTVNQITLTPNTDVSLPPFAGALKLLESPPPLDEAVLESEEEGDEEEMLGRDLLGEMEIAARIMITGGDEREDARMSRADRLVIRKAILLAANRVRASGREQVLTEDVVTALRLLGNDEALPPARRARAVDMADGMELFCSGLAGHIFNREGVRWPEVDVTILEMGILAREGYEDQLTVAYLGMMNHINDLVERHQCDTRPTLVVTDEGHIITTNPLLASYVVKITKMWRKYGAWFWIATQNLEDFPNAARKMLNMMEWWLCLVMPKEEVEQIARFKDLTAEQRTLLLSAHKEPGKYVEGVVLADQIEALFRSVPPPICLALAMTEKHEKAERAEIMRTHHCSELEAARIVAGRIAQGCP